MTKVEKKAVDVLDRLTARSWTAFPIFLLVVYALFWCTFSLGRYPMGWIQEGTGVVSGFLNAVISPSWLRALAVDGILAGVGGVLAFLPNIAILYLLISLMESTGYLGRAAFIMDKVMHGMGLHGRSFIPMIMGFGCNVPAILACRDIQSPKSRLITVMVIPYMSCSGRLPVYLLLTAAFFPEYAPLMLLGIYGLGMIVAVIAAKVLSVTVPGVASHDHIQINPYTAPDWKYVFGNTWEQMKEYMKKLAGPILAFSIALWAAGHFPVPDTEMSEYDRKEQSCIGRLGHLIEPALTPMGMNWKDGVAIVAGVGAKELIVSTLGVMYSDSGASLTDALEASHTKAGALAFMVFVLLYFPCIGTFVAIRKVLGGWKWALGSAVGNIVIAWAMAAALFFFFSFIL